MCFLAQMMLTAVVTLSQLLHIPDTFPGILYIELHLIFSTKKTASMIMGVDWGREREEAEEMD